MSAETLCSAMAILRGTEPISAVSALTRVLFILLRSLIFFLLLGFFQWLSRAEMVLTLNVNI